MMQQQKKWCATLLQLGFLVYLVHISLEEIIVLTLYLVDESILKKFCWVFFPKGVSQHIYLCVVIGGGRCRFLWLGDVDVTSSMGK